MAYGRSQSDIATVRDQLSIDYAEGKYLNVVTANLGIERPVFGFSDAVWRAAVKAIALQYKQVRSAFESVLDVVLGPEFYRVTGLLEEAEVGQTKLLVVDASNLPQCGTLVLDRGLPEEETLDYVFVDYATNTVYLSAETTQHHNTNADSMEANRAPVTFLTVDSPAGALSLTTFDSSQFPDYNYPYTIVIDYGTENEESLVVTNNSGTVLTLQSVTTKDHYRPRPSVIYTTTSVAYGADALFLTGDDTSQFPPSGYVLIDGSEIVAFTSNDTTTGVLNLQNELSTTYAVGTRVEYLPIKDSIVYGQVQVEGCGWKLYQTTPRKVEIYIPEDCQDVGNLLSASYLHGQASAAASTTLAMLASAGDEYVDVTSSAAFPDSGTITIEPGSGQTRAAYYKHPSIANRLVLGNPLAGSHLVGVTVDLYQPVHTGTLLSGDIFNVEDVWAGPYVYEPNTEGPSYTTTTLTENLAGPTRIMLGVDDTSVTAIEVEDASLFPTIYPFTARLGIGTGNREDVEVTAVTLRQVADTTVDVAGALAGDTFLPCVAGTVTSFPNVNGYRVRINRGGGTEEIAFVTSRTGAGFNFESGLANAHVAGESVELVSDVLSVTSVGDQHTGVFEYSERSETNPSFGATHQESYAETVHPVYSAIGVTSGTGFSTRDDSLYLNFGHSLASYRAQLTASVSPGGTTLSFTSTADFPTAAYLPCYVVLGAGTYNQEVVRITGNNTGLNQLTVDVTRPCKYAHDVDEWVEFRAPTPEVVEFDSRSGNTFSFSPSIVLNSNHIVGETVCTAQESIPDRYGTDFPLRMPPDVVTRLRFLFDLVRAAGVEVVFLTAR